MPLYNKEIRLNRGAYWVQQKYFVTLCCFERQLVFREEPTWRWILAELLKCGSRHQFVLHAYCVMPDHLHLVAQGQASECDLLRVCRQFQATYRLSLQAGMRRLSGKAGRTITFCGRRIMWRMRRVTCGGIRCGQGLCVERSSIRYRGCETIDWMKWKAQEARMEAALEEDAGAERD